MTSSNSARTVRKLRNSLHAKAKSEPSFRFYGGGTLNLTHPAPTNHGAELRLRCVTQPYEAQRALIDRLGMSLPRRLRVPVEVPGCSDNSRP